MYEILRIGPLPKANMRLHANFRADRLNFFGNMVFDFRHLGFVLRVFGPPTKSICWSLSLYKIWLESMQ